MKIKFCGGTEEVTGANYLLKTEKISFLIDCGLIQRENICELENFEDFPYNPEEIKFVLITHSHLDHIGRLPKLIYDGFKGEIISTLPTKDLAKEILLDANKVIAEKCKGLDFDVKEIYNEEIVERIFTRWRTVDYHEILEFDGLKIEFFDAGHILGSAFIKLEEGNKKIVFSGDLGNIDSILKPAEDLPEDDYLILESTYGDRLHENLENRKEILEDIIEETLKEKRTLIIPAFALERTQEILYDIIDLIENKKVPEIKVFLDSPLAIRIFRIYDKYTNYFNENAKKFFVHRDLEDLDYAEIIYESKDFRKIKNYPAAKIIISSSGMLQGGRIIDILKYFVQNESTTILFVGYQSKGSIGRQILEGAKEIYLDGEKYIVKAKIEKILAYSGHKDQKALIDWIFPQRFKLKKIFLVQGEQNAKVVLKSKIEDYLGIKAEIPIKNTEVDL